MSHGICRGPTGTDDNILIANGGISPRGAAAISGPQCLETDQNPQIFESIVQALETSVLNVGTHAAVEGQVRTLYSTRIKALTNELRTAAMRGDITWKQAATEANLVRNNVMDALRGKSTPFGRALAQSLKKDGKTLNTMVAEKTAKLFGPDADFNKLSHAQKDKVYADVIKSAGKSNPRVNRVMRISSRAGRGLIVLSVATAVYNIATAEDKADAAAQEAKVAGAGVAGGIAGGALAGLACGPGAPVCVGLGAFAGGALAAFGVDWFW